jgi:hypothetical protein
MLTRSLALILAATFGPGASLASARTLECTNGPQYERLEARLAEDSPEPGSGYVRVVDASITDNYATAQLTCVGDRPQEVTCVGFWFNRSNEVVEVKVRKRGGRLTSTYRPLVGSYAQNPGPWPCEIK